jgi:hypothetical protein
MPGNSLGDGIAASVLGSVLGDGATSGAVGIAGEALGGGKTFDGGDRSSVTDKSGETGAAQSSRPTANRKTRIAHSLGRHHNMSRNETVGESRPAENMVNCR